MSPRVACRRRFGRQDVRLDAFSRSSPPGGCSYLRPVPVRLGGVTQGGRSLPSRRDEIFYSIIGRDGHGYTLTYGTGIPRSHIARAESFGASSSQGLRLCTDEEVEQLLESMKDLIRAELKAELRAEMAELETRLSQSRGPIASDPLHTTQAPDAGSGH